MLHWARVTGARWCEL